MMGLVIEGGGGLGNGSFVTNKSETVSTTVVFVCAFPSLLLENSS
jgi:hypothetical protein